MIARQVFTPILIAASLVLLISFAIRASFGVFKFRLPMILVGFELSFRSRSRFRI